MKEKLDLEVLTEVGKFTRNLREEVYDMPKLGVTSKQIIDFLEKKIFAAGYLPSFPAMIAVNEQAAHYTVFDEDYTFQKGDVLKIDFGVSKDGFITDNAFTVEIETKKYEKQMKANLDALNLVMEHTKLGMTMSEIGEIVDNRAKEDGFNTIHNLSGHEVGKNKLHCGLSVPNYKNGNKAQIVDNTQLAVEPFLTPGEPKIMSAGPCNILHLTSSKQIRDPIAKKVLKYIKENYPHLPFSKRWLIKDVAKDLGIKTWDKCFEKNKVLYALKVLKKYNIIHEYDILSTVDGAYATQYEDCVVFVDGQKEIITRLK